MSINLYQPVEQQKKRNIMDNVVLYAVFLLLVIFAAYGGIMTYTEYAYTREIVKTKEAIRSQESKLSSEEANKIYDLSLRLNEASTIERTVKMNEMLSNVEPLIVGGSWLTSFGYDRENNFITLKGAVNSLDILAKQLYNFRTSSVLLGSKVESLGVDTNGKHMFGVQIPVSAQ